MPGISTDRGNGLRTCLERLYRHCSLLLKQLSRVCQPISYHSCYPNGAGQQVREDPKRLVEGGLAKEFKYHPVDWGAVCSIRDRGLSIRRLKIFNQALLSDCAGLHVKGRDGWGVNDDEIWCGWRD